MEHRGHPELWDAIHRMVGHPDIVQGFGKFAVRLEKINAKRVLDAGCGSGRHTLALAKRIFITPGSNKKSRFEVHAIDFSPAALRKTGFLLKEQGQKAKLKYGKLQALPYPGGFFNGAVSTEVIEHGTAEERKQALKELARVLAPKGLLLITAKTEHMAPRLNASRELQELAKQEAQLPHAFYNNANEFERELKESGFNLTFGKVQKHKEGFFIATVQRK